jgi:low temperature requirement protein LtrA
MASLVRPREYDHFSNALVWELATGLVWIVGIFAEGDSRLTIWIIAVLVTYAGVIAGHPLPGRSSPFSSDSQIYAEHLLERFRLFFLIALGETVLTIGNAFTNVPLDAERVIALTASFAGTVALWWCYFHRAERVGKDAVEGTGDASRLVAVGNYTLVGMVVGIIAIAVGDELALGIPAAGGHATSAALIFGGPAIFLLAQLTFIREATGTISDARIGACVALAFLALVTAPFSLLAAIIASTLVLLAVAVVDTRAGEPSTTTL